MNVLVTLDDHVQILDLNCADLESLKSSILLRRLFASILGSLFLPPLPHPPPPPLPPPPHPNMIRMIVMEVNLVQIQQYQIMKIHLGK